MVYPMILEKDYGFGVEFATREDFVNKLSAHRDELSEADQESVWAFARDWERENNLTGDTSRFSTDVEDIVIQQEDHK